MPKIYELPAMVGLSTMAGITEPSNVDQPTGAALDVRAQPQQPTWKTTGPMQASLKMLDNQMRMGRRGVTQWFDAHAAILSQQQFEPDKYRAEYGKLQRQATTKYAEVKAKAEAQANHVKSMQELVQNGMMSPEQMEQTMFVMAGVPAEHVRATYAKIKPQKPSTQLNEIDSQLKKIAAFQDQFEDYRDDPWYKPGKKGTIWYTPKIGGKKTGPRRRIKEDETELLQALEDAKDRAAELRQARRKIFKIMTPMEQYARQGSQAIERFGMGYETPQRALGIGDMRFEEPEPVPVKLKQLTKDIAIAILKEAGNDQKRAEQIAKERGYKIKGYKL